jgi:hypothetical protein
VSPAHRLTHIHRCCRRDGTSVSKHHQFVAGLSLNIAKDDDGDQANIDILLTLPTVALNQLVSGLRIAKDDDDDDDDDQTSIDRLLTQTTVL